MPWLAVEKEYVFEGSSGEVGLLDLFDGRRQLIVYRFFFEPGVDGWPDRGCAGRSLLADQVAHLAHLNARDTTLVFILRAQQPEIERWKTRMGWKIPWFTITDDFDSDFGEISTTSTARRAEAREVAAPGQCSPITGHHADRRPRPGAR